MLWRFVNEYAGLRGDRSLVMLSFWRLLNILGSSMGIGTTGFRRDLFISRYTKRHMWVDGKRERGQSHLNDKDA
jgi:hypothetical protein